MAGRVNHRRFERSGFQRIGLRHALVDLYFARRRHAAPHRLHVEHFEQGVVVLIQKDWGAGGRTQLHRSAHVVDVSMRDHDLLDLEVMFGDNGNDIFDVIARIDHHRFARGVISDDRAVALQRPNRENFVDHYFCCAGPGFAGADFAGCELTPCSTDFGPLLRDAYTDSVIDVTIKMMADQVVAFESAVAAPRGPNAVWLPMPPKAAAMSPLLPLCSSTTMIRNKHTIMWTIVIRMTMSLSDSPRSQFQR